jgi:hypothetical protein
MGVWRAITATPIVGRVFKTLVYEQRHFEHILWWRVFEIVYLLYKCRRVFIMHGVLAATLNCFFSSDCGGVSGAQARRPADLWAQTELPSAVTFMLGVRALIQRPSLRPLIRNFPLRARAGHPHTSRSATVLSLLLLLLQAHPVPQRPSACECCGG